MNRPGYVPRYKIKPISFPERERYLYEYALAQALAERRGFSNWVVGLILEHYRRNQANAGAAPVLSGPGSFRPLQGEANALASSEAAPQGSKTLDRPAQRGRAKEPVRKPAEFVGRVVREAEARRKVSPPK